MATVENKKNTADTDEILLKDILIKFKEWRKYIISRWKTILIASLIGGVMGLIYSFIYKPVYSAELSFAIQEDNSSGGGGLSSALGLASQLGVDLGNDAGGAFSADNLLTLMKSRSMVENTLLNTVKVDGKDQTLAELYISFNDLRSRWSEPELKNVHFLPNQSRSTFTLKQDSILGVCYKRIIKKNLDIDKINKTESLSTIKVESTNEQFSYYFTTILVKTVSDFYIATKTTRSAENVVVLQRQTDSVRRELNSAITGVAETGDINPNPNPSLQIIRVPSLRRQVDVQANTAILTELVKDLELSKVSLRKETPLIQVIDRPILPLEKKKIGKILGSILGVFTVGFLTVFYLSCQRIFRSILA